MEFISLILWFIYAVKGLPLPYVWIDFDYVHDNNHWVNDNGVRAQIANDGQVPLDNTFATSATRDNNGATVGVFACNNQINGNPWNTPHTAAFLPPLAYNEFTLEVVVKATSNNIVSKGYIIGIEGLWGDTSDGNSIAYNAINGKISSQPNKFFPANFVQSGWHATDAYFTSTINTDPIDITKFHHVIVSQDRAGLVSVYVNGKPYGSSYQAIGGAKTNTQQFPYIKICGDDFGNIGFEGHIRSFGFYTSSFTDVDAFDACKLSGAEVSCETLEPTESPTPKPTPKQCILGQGYYVEGNPGIVAGDPHFTLFNGDRHDFQGRGNPNQQFYYMHPCKGESRDDMPFTILGKHRKVGGSSVSVLDYITLELYDPNNEYLLWLSSTKHSWTQRGQTISTLYDLNPVMTNLVSGTTLNIGQRFKVHYIKSGSRVDLTLTIDDICHLKLHMYGSYLQVQPPQCYKCYTCGLLGDFQRPKSNAVIKRLRTCSGGFFQYRQGWDLSNIKAYDIGGWSWEKGYVERHCKNNWNRRLIENEEGEYFIEIDAEFVYVDPCASIVQQAVIDKCAETRNAVSICCNIIGGEFCNNLQKDCEIDACALIGTDTNLLTSTVNEIFIEPVNLVCSLPGAETMFDPQKLEAVPCVNLQWIEIATENMGVNPTDDTFRFLDFENEIYSKYDISDIKKYKLEWDLNPEINEYFNSIEFELSDSNPFKMIFKDQVPLNEFGQEDIKINILSSTILEITVSDEQIFCKACSSENVIRFGDTCWAILDKTDMNRGCGCNSGGWTGQGIYYGGWQSGQCNQCNCFGGGFAGFKTNHQQKGGLPSTGLKLSIAVC